MSIATMIAFPLDGLLATLIVRDAARMFADDEKIVSTNIEFLGKKFRVDRIA